MTTRRDAMKTVAGGLVFVGCGLHGVAHAQTAAPKAKRRETAIAGKRVKTVDIHAHCAVPEALALTGQKLGGPALRPDLDTATEVALRLQTMDEQGIDMEALSINATYYGIKERDLAAKVIQIQNEKLAEAVGKNPDRFVAFASAALQFPDLAAQQLEDGVKKYNLRGVAIGGNVAGKEISDRRSIRSGPRWSSWAFSSSFIRRRRCPRS
jgi:aminocarboxymuconate-semialdehyde decarboxylase